MVLLTSLPARLLLGVPAALSLHLNLHFPKPREEDLNLLPDTPQAIPPSGGLACSPAAQCNWGKEGDWKKPACFLKLKTELEEINRLRNVCLLRVGFCGSLLLPPLSMGATGLAAVWLGFAEWCISMCVCKCVCVRARA